VDFGDFLCRDGEAGTPFREEGDGGGAEDGENVRDAVNGVVLKNLRGIADVADREVLSDRVRHEGNRNSNSNSNLNSIVFGKWSYSEKFKRSGKLGKGRKTRKGSVDWNK